MPLFLSIETMHEITMYTVYNYCVQSLSIITMYNYHLTMYDITMYSY